MNNAKYLQCQIVLSFNHKNFCILASSAASFRYRINIWEKKKIRTLIIKVMKSASESKNLCEGSFRMGWAPACLPVLGEILCLRIPRRCSTSAACAACVQSAGPARSWATVVGGHAVRQSWKIHCVCAMERNPEKGALGIKTLEKSVPGKAGWTTDF